jgi:predicted nucleic acid-binding Zn ribbon protein
MNRCIYCGETLRHGVHPGRYCSEPCREEGAREQQRTNDIIIDMNFERDLERAAEESFSQEP